MLRIFADKFVKLLDDLTRAELEASGIVNQKYTAEEFHERAVGIGVMIHELNKDCTSLHLRSASKQVRFITESLLAKPNDMSEFPRLLAELRRRTREDLEDVVMYSVDPNVVGDFYSVAKDGPLKGKLIRLSLT